MGRMQQCEFTVGLALRRQFRRILRSRGLDFTEEKGWLDSQFIIRGNGDQLRPLFALAVGDPPTR